MPSHDPFSSTRYLRSKETVDDRALNRRIWNQFLDGLSDIYVETGALRIFEVGGGVGATVKRLAQALPGTPIKSVDYTLVDISPNHVEAARQELPNWGREHGYRVRDRDAKIELESEWGTIRVELIEADAFQYFDQQHSSSEVNAVIAQAWFDLINIKKALTAVRKISHSGALLYLPIHFDGVTTFLPTIDEQLDHTIQRLYHHSMDQRSTSHGPAGGSETGRKLLEVLPEMEFFDLTVGSSDWIVLAREDGEYTADEAYFLRHILKFFERELTHSDGLDQKTLNEWIAQRRAQIETGELVYIAHQLDILARSP